MEESLQQKIKRNLKEGTFLKNASIALKNRLLKKVKHSNLIFFLDEGRILTKKYQSDIKKINANQFKIANYYLDSRVPVNKKSIVYSLGILNDISFDLAVQKRFGCNVFMYDPTPVTQRFMQDHASNKFLIYNPFGVWIKNTTLRFYEPVWGGSSSVMAEDKGGNYFDAKCYTMNTLMQQNKHHEISIFKADIEGAALPVLQQMLTENILPDQIVGEFERPRKSQAKMQDFFKDLSNLRSRLAAAGYEEFLLPREKAKYFSLEMLFVKKSKTQ